MFQRRCSTAVVVRTVRLNQNCAICKTMMIAASTMPCHGRERESASCIASPTNNAAVINTTGAWLNTYNVWFAVLCSVSVSTAILSLRRQQLHHFCFQLFLALDPANLF